MARYTLTNETTNEVADFTNKKNAARRLREWKAAGAHVSASIYNENGVRIDNGSASALAAIIR